MNTDVNENTLNLLVKCHKLLTICFEYNKKEVLKRASEMELSLDNLYHNTGEKDNCIDSKYWKKFVENAVNWGGFDDNSTSEITTLPKPDSQISL